MLSKGFVESHLRQFLDDNSLYKVVLFINDVQVFISTSWIFKKILSFHCYLFKPFSFKVYTKDFILHIYTDCIKVYDFSGVLLHEYRED